MIKNIVILAAAAITSSQTLAISKNISSTKQFYINQVEGVATSYGLNKSQPSSFGKIGFEESDKYLMINMGADVLFGDFSNYTIFDDHFFPDVQDIDPNPTGKAWWSYSKRADHFQKVSDVQRTCLETVVDSNQEFAVSSPFERLCDVKMENDNKRAILRGYTCYLSLDYRRTFKVSHRIRKECSDASFLAANDILPQEVTGGVSFSISDDDSGSSNYKILGRTKTQITINPGSSIEVYDNYRKNTPNWPAKMVVDATFAGVTVQKRGEKFTIAPKVLADNQCGDFRKSVSVCDYMQPLGIEFKLYEVRPNGKKVLVNLWYDGTVLPAQWRGIVPLKGFQAYMDEGKSYVLEGDARYPDMYYRLSKEKFSHVLIPLIGVTELNNPDLDVFPTLEGLKGLDAVGKLGKYPKLPSLQLSRAALKGDVSTFDQAIQELENLVMGSGAWPPYLSEICTAEGACSNPKNTKYNLKAAFTLSKAATRTGRFGRESYEPKGLSMTRETSFGTYSATTTKEIKFSRKAVRTTPEAE